MIKNKDEKKRDLINRVRENKKFKPEDSEAMTKIVNQQLSDYTVVISESEGITGQIFNGPHGLIRYTKGDKEQTILRYSGSIGPVYKMDESWGLELNINHKKLIIEIDNAVKYIKNRFYLTPGQTQKLQEILLYFVQDNEKAKNYENYFSSPITVDNGIIHVDFAQLDNLDILKKLLDFHPKSSHPDYFLEVFCYDFLAPFHNDLKHIGSSVIQTPLLLAEGTTRGGKTSIPVFFIGRGFDLQKDKFLYGSERIKTQADLNVHANESNIPMICDDIKTAWLDRNKDALKSYVQTGIFADRGKQNGIELNELKGKRSMIFTLNDKYRIDTDLAISNRIFIETFTKLNAERQNKAEFSAFIKSLPSGFMFSLIKELFEGKKITDLYSEIENLEEPVDWLNLGLKKINALCVKYNLATFPLIHTKMGIEKDSNALEVAQAFLGEAERQKSTNYHSKIESDFRIERKNDRLFIYFTAGALKTLNSTLNLKLPYASAIDFINNVKSNIHSVSVENDGRTKNVRIGEYVKSVYCISVPDSERDEEDNGDSNLEFEKQEYPSDEKKSLHNFNIDSLPDGPVKQSLKEEQERAQSTDNKTPNKQTTKEIQKPSKIPKNPKMCCYKIMDHFDAYPDSYFDGSDIILDSYRPIYHKSSSNISYILVKVLIPENLSKQPGNWMKFLVDSQEISQKAFETLSRGDSQ